MSRYRAMIPILSACIRSMMATFFSSFLRFSSMNSTQKSIISEAEDFDLRFFFFFGLLGAGSLLLSACRSSPSSSVELPSAGNDATVASGIIFGLSPKNSDSSSWKSHSFLLCLGQFQKRSFPPPPHRANPRAFDFFKNA